MKNVSRIGVHSSVDAFPPERLCETLSDIEPTVRVVGDEIERIEECDAVVTLEHRNAFLESGLTWVHAISAGVDQLPLERYQENGIVVTNSSGIHGDCMGENVVGIAVVLSHRLTVFARDQFERRWRPDVAWEEKYPLTGDQACVVGLGAIGSRVAAYLDRFGMDVVGVKRTPQSVPHVQSVYASENLHDAIADARIVVLTVPLTDETHGLIGSREFETMRDDAYLINVSRGAVVDEQALIDALEDGTIAGAGLDVFEEEPPPDDSPLWTIQDVVITPHVSGAFRTYDEAIADLIRENLTRLNEDEPLVNRVV